MLIAKTKQSGFTIVELLIVVVVIAILAAITIVAYNGIQTRASFTREKSDMVSINKAIQMYYVDNGAYPVKTAWGGWGQVTGDAFIPGLSPKYISVLPQMPSSTDTDATYLYQSTAGGAGYKLIRYSSAAGLPKIQLSDNPLIDSMRGTRAWGYWSETGASQ